MLYHDWMLYTTFIYVYIKNRRSVGKFCVWKISGLFVVIVIFTHSLTLSPSRSLCLAVFVSFRKWSFSAVYSKHTWILFVLKLFAQTSLLQTFEFQWICVSKCSRIRSSCEKCVKNWAQFCVDWLDVRCWCDFGKRMLTAFDELHQIVEYCLNMLNMFSVRYRCDW